MQHGGESKAHPRGSRGSTIAAEAFMSHEPHNGFGTNVAKIVSTYYLTYPWLIMSYNVHTTVLLSYCLSSTVQTQKHNHKHKNHLWSIISFHDI